ncbi:MAG: hypothetical protein GOV00_01640, partial [Candidatus Altiarchaeota archaeon]|nr:hypothetical protein [Candidatus Altiarchaeota archaeon]
MVSTTVNVPEEMLGRLIGVKGKTKRLIERMGGVKIKIKDCLVAIKGEDGIQVMKASEVVRAISEGLPVKNAFELFQEDYQLVIYDIESVVPNRAALDRQKARVIGEKGKTKHYFERMLEIKLHIGDSKIFAIGPGDKLRIFREALERLV